MADASMCAYVYMYICMYLCVYIYIHTYTCVRVCVYIHIQYPHVFRSKIFMNKLDKILATLTCMATVFFSPQPKKLRFNYSTKNAPVQSSLTQQNVIHDGNNV